MSPTKARGLLLRMLPYRESSGILYVYTDQFGLLHGIAKGIRRRTKRSVPIERGALLELLAYVRPHRSLHTVGSVEVLEYYPSVRADLLRSALRDAAFEAALTCLHPEEPNPELFGIFAGLMSDLESMDLGCLVPYRLWRFYTALARSLGFGLNLDRCVDCGRPLDQAAGGALATQHGGLSCSDCAAPAASSAVLPAAVVTLLRDSGAPAPPRGAPTPDQQRTITRLLARYCYHHADVRDESRALDFLCGMLG